MQRHAAAPLAMGIDQRKDLTVDLRLREPRRDEIAFPGTIRFSLPVLDGTAAADAEVLAEGFDPFGAWLLDPDQLPPVRMMTGHNCNVDHFATKRIGHKDASSLDKRDAIAEMADMIDGEAFNHGARR
jgi:hypothetical protein